MENRVNLSTVAPEIYKSVFAVERLATEFASSAGLATGFCHLLRLRASQINQCAYCVRMHTSDALKSGESAERVSVLPAWRETDYFDKKERAALALIESVTLISVGQVHESVYLEAVESLSDKEIAAVEWIGVVINAWNRIATSSRYLVKP